VVCVLIFNLLPSRSSIEEVATSSKGSAEAGKRLFNNFKCRDELFRAQHRSLSNTTELYSQPYIFSLARALSRPQNIHTA